MRSILEASALLERTASRTPGSRASLLAFVADAESERNLRECFEQLGHDEATIVRGGITKAIAALGTQRSPELLIVDISGIALPVSEIQNLAEVCEPGVVVIAIGDRNEVGLYRDLLHAGVSDYIVKPLTGQLLEKALRDRTGTSEPDAIHRKLGTCVAVIGARGGVGTTTLAVNLAWYLAQRCSRRVALVDLDLHNGECALALNIAATSGLREALVNPARIDSILLERIMMPVGERLFVLSTEEPLRDTIEFGAEAVESLIGVLRQRFHYVVLDLPRNPAAAYLRALDIADFRIIVVDQTLRSARDAVRLRSALDESGQKHRTIFVVNRHGENGRHAITLDEMQRIIELRPKAVIPFHPAWFAVATGSSERLAVAQRGKFREAIAGLVLEVSGRPTQPRRWWQRAS